MGKSRLEAFSDGVIAILITIMILELKVPAGHELADLRPMVGNLLAYLMSFVYLGIYWNNHHHLFQAVKKVNGAILWTNLHLLFWLSLLPLATLWLAESHFATVPTVIYGAVLGCCGVAYYLMAQCLVAYHGEKSTIAAAIGADIKGKISIVVYLVAIGLAFVSPNIAMALYVAVAMMWLVPDRRIERILIGEE